MPKFVVDRMPWLLGYESPPYFNMDHTMRVISIPYRDGITESQILALQLEHAREKGAFQVLKGWRDELYPVIGVEGRHVVMERSGSALFGIETWGLHLNAYCWVPVASPLSTLASSTSGTSATLDPAFRTRNEKTEELKLWIPRRSATKSTYPSMLDNTVAGGISAGESPYKSMLRECEEEASLPGSLVRSSVRSVGTVSYVHIRDERAGGETGLIQPEVQFCYDLELDPGHVPKPGDDEVASFTLMSVKEVREELARGAFKPNCAIVVVDFLIRQGLLGPADDGLIREKEGLDKDEKERQREAAYRQVVSRMHGRTDLWEGLRPSR